MIKIETSIVINRSIEEVFAFVTDVEKMPQRSAELLEAKKTSEGPVGVGTTFSAVAKFLGRRMENDHNVIGQILSTDPKYLMGEMRTKYE